MPGKPVIWIVDTSVFLNVLDVPGFNQDREEVLDTYRQRIENEDSFFLPFTTILESGNHIAQLTNGNLRRRFAQRFCEEVQRSLAGDAPWKPLAFPREEELQEWLRDFPQHATSGIGLGDSLIIAQWREQCRMFEAYVVRIWSLDSDLQGYLCNE